MDLFYFNGEVPPSKSILNRLLVIQKFNPQIQIQNSSESRDVVYLNQALHDFSQGKTQFDCGDGGTTFRFLAVFLSRFAGKYEITVENSLQKRPHESLLEVLHQAGATAVWQDNTLHLNAKGWGPSEKHIFSFRLTADQTSQVASALILNAWDLPHPLIVSMPNELMSYEYFQMTLQLSQQFGLQFEQAPENTDETALKIASKQLPKSLHISAEPDVSSCFPLAVLGALKQPVHLTNFPLQSLQPDFAFLHFFQRAKVAYDLSEDGLKVFPSQNLTAFSADVLQCPDLFPVLCAFASFCEGISVITGLSRLSYKESDRLLHTKRLLEIHEIDFEHDGDQFKIESFRHFKIKNPDLKNQVFITANDHRMGMAATVFQVMGSEIKLDNSNVFAKSFPEFLTCVRPLLPFMFDSKIHEDIRE